MAPEPRDILLRCRCGHVSGVAKQVTPNEGFRFICYCADCQAFARFLERPDVLDSAGGTDILQMPVGQVQFSDGLDAVRCLKLSAKVFRWYSECCRTPIGNTAGARFPIIGLIHAIMSHDGHARDMALGAPLCRIYESSAVGPLPPNAPPPASARLFILRASKLLSWWMRGLGQPNPLFDVRTKAPISEPRLLNSSERAGVQ